MADVHIRFVNRALLSRIAKALGTVEGLSYLLGAIFGVGCIGYVAVTWAIHLAKTGQYLSAGASLLVVLAVSGFAAVRVPIALWLFFGTAVVLGTAFLLGAGNVVLP